jgi:hypothetical protein
VLELRPISAGVIGCFAQSDALDAIDVNGEPGIRVAPDELLLLGRRDRLGEIEAELAARDEHGVAVDLSGGFALYGLRGEDRLEAFCRLSAIELPAAPAVAQGMVAHVPAKVLVLEDELVVIVPSVLSHHFRERVLAACADLSPSEAGAGELAAKETTLA